MNPTTLKTTTTTTRIALVSPFSPYEIPSRKQQCFNHFLTQPNKKHSLKSLKSIFRIPKPSFSCSSTTPIETDTNTVSNKLQRLVFEFRSLTEPIDRVKRLLHHATTLPSFAESARTESNRVKGCTTQVWLEAGLDEFGKMRFRADSDSEITKGFIACLVWLLDEADPGEVLSVAAEDLTEMNVGVHGKEKSRVNTWHNVLFAMQERTKRLVAEREKLSPIEPPPPPFSAALVIGGAADAIKVLDLSAYR